MKKILGSFLLVLVVSLGLVGCGIDMDKDTTHPNALVSAISSLDSYSDEYVIQTYISAPDGNLSYIEVCGDGYSYTEYPIDSDGNVGTVSDGEVQSYMLSDWLSDSGMYLTTSITDVSDTSSYMKLPDSYADVVEDRRTMNLVSLSDELYNIELLEESDGVSVYSGKMTSDGARELLGVGTEVLYTALLDDADSGSDVEKLLNYLLEECDMDLVFSEANIAVGVEDGLPVYFNIEVGGLGSRLYVYKEISYVSVDERDEPDFSSSTEYLDTLSVTASYISDCETNDEIEAVLNELSSNYYNTELDVVEEEVSEIETEETVEETE